MGATVQPSVANQPGAGSAGRARSRTEPHHQRIQLAFGEVRHKRLRPHEHAFRYRAWFVRAPLRALETRSGNWLFGINRRALLSLCSSDHGGRTDTREWIESLLAQAGVEVDGEIWLHAFARVLGYSFKPVSFWYCHRADGTLAAVIAEVHNTFGEQHVYVLADPGGRALRSGELLHAGKSFHVSPFCAVTGAYRFRFINRDDRTIARIDYDDEAGPLLLTSLSGSFDPLSARSALRALLGFPLFSLGVIARIHWQALKLWLNRVPFHRKPAAPEQIFTRGSP